MNLDLLTPSIELGLVTTNLDAMVDFYEGFLGLELQGVIDFEDGSQRRYALGSGVLKLVTYTSAPPLPPTPGGGRAQAGLRYFTIGVTNLRDVARGSRQLATNSSNRLPSSSRSRGWAGCSSLTPTAIPSSCSAPLLASRFGNDSASSNP